MKWPRLGVSRLRPFSTRVAIGLAVQQGGSQLSRQLRITLVRGLAGKNERQKAVAFSLGLRKPGSTVVKPDNPAVRGMIQKVAHLVAVEEIAG